MNYISYFKKIRLWAPVFVCAGLLLMAPYARAQQTTVTSQLTHIKDQVQQLFELQDSTTIPEQQKELQEFRLRQQILTDIIAAAKQQVADARARLQDAVLPQDNNETWKQIRDAILGGFDRANEYYGYAYDRVNHDSSVTTALLKNVARDIEQEKTTTIDPLIKQAHTIVAALAVQNMLQIGDDRLEKIRLDVGKIYEQKLTKSKALQNLFDTASSTLEQAHQADQSAQEIILHGYDPQPNASDTQYIDDLYAANTASSTASTTAPQSISNESKFSLVEKLLQKNITDAIAGIKSVYDTFLEMSSNVKNYLK